MERHGPVKFPPGENTFEFAFEFDEGQKNVTVVDVLRGDARVLRAKVPPASLKSAGKLQDFKTKLMRAVRAYYVLQHKSADDGYSFLPGSALSSGEIASGYGAPNLDRYKEFGWGKPGAKARKKSAKA